jgi:transposase-like protein
MSIHKLICPSCGSNHIFKNGTIHNKKQKYQCQNYQRQFVENSQRDYISNETKKLIDKLLLEKISLAGITRVTGVS